MKNWFLILIFGVFVTGCSSPPLPTALQEDASSISVGQSFPVIPERWVALQGNNTQQWLFEWILNGSVITPVLYQSKTEFFYYAQHSDHILIIGKDAFARQNVVRYLSSNGVSPTIMHELDDDSLNTLVSVWFIKGNQP